MSSADDPTLPIAPPATVAAQDQDTRIGRYRLIEKLGEGGFGTVWRAEQTEPIQREVALKVVKAGMDSREITARFEAERQALALMDHPNIAAVLDAGATDAGRPYFVMELVRGLPITEYCNARQLPLRSRLELFVPVCQAVQHAHQKAILHRDLKPSNILVAEVDGRPDPKVIDFGIAKALGSGGDDILHASLARTIEGTILGTPQYMSPEQAGSAPDVDTRSDVYSLGVLLYQLLTGHTPLDPSQLKRAALDEVLRLVREQEPVRPSTRLLAATHPPQTTASGRSEGARKLGRQMRGDLDWVVMKSLEKDRNRRYQSAGELAEDLARHLRNEPVTAGPPGGWYRLRKIIRRHRAAVLAAAAVFGTLVAGITVTARLLYREKQALSEASAVRDVLVNSFSSPSPWKSGRSVTVAEVLDQAVKGMAGKIKDNPLTEAALTRALADAYKGLGLYEEALPLARRNLALQIRQHGEFHVGTALALEELAHLRDHQGDDREALELVKRQRAVCARLYGERHAMTLNAQLAQAGIESDLAEYDKAEAGMRDAVKGLVALEGEKGRTAIAARVNLAILQSRRSRLPEAEAGLRDALRDLKEVFGARHPDTVSCGLTLAGVLRKSGNLGEAERMFRDLLPLESAVLGENHPNTLEHMKGHALLLHELGRTAEAAARMQDVTARLEKVNAETARRQMPSLLNTIAGFHLDLKQVDDADRALTRALPLARELLGKDDPLTLNIIGNLALVRQAQKRLQEAYALQKEALEGKIRTLGPEHELTIKTLVNVAELLMKTGDQDRAAPLIERATEVALRTMPERSGTRWQTLFARSQLLFMQGKFQEAEDQARQLWQSVSSANPPDPSNLTRTLDRLMFILCKQGKFREAEAELAGPIEELLKAELRGNDARSAARVMAYLYSQWNESSPSPDLQQKAAQWRARGQGTSSPPAATK